MNLNKKGFTLIELLAVIVILAIILVIAVSRVQNIINQSKISSFKSSTIGMYRGVKTLFFNDILNNENINSLDLGKDGEKIIKFSGNYPDAGLATLDVNSKINMYVYDDTLKLCGVLDSDTEDFTFFDDKNMRECAATVSIIPQPVLLKDIATIGDYIDYDAGNWTTTVAMPTTQGSYGGYVTDTSKNQGLACESAGAVVNGRYGWRVIDINSTTGEVSIIHVGTPECYYHNVDTSYSVPNLLNRDYSYYVNTNLATSADIFTKEMAETLTGITIANGVDMPRDSTVADLTVSGSRYFFPTSYGANYLLYVQTGGYIGAYRYIAYGIRPVVKLKPNLYVLSGTGTSLEKYVVNETFTQPQVVTKDGTITGYWQNWNGIPGTSNLRLKNVPSYYDIVAIAFGYTQGGSSKGTVDFSLNITLSNRLSNYTEEDFKNDIQILKSNGKKVVLSIGGAGNTITVDDSASVSAFVSSVNSLIEEYDFDGIDINFEGGMSPTYLADAIRQVADNYGTTLILTMAPQTVDFKVNGLGVVSGNYYDLLTEVKDITTMVNMQMYNSGTQYGLNGVIYSQGTVDFSTALATILIEKGLNASQVGLGSHYLSTNGGYMLPSKFVDAYNSLINGGTTIGGTYVVPHAYTDFGGFMIWSINGDYSIGNSFSNAYNTVLTN